METQAAHSFQASDKAVPQSCFWAGAGEWPGRAGLCAGRRCPLAEARGTAGREVARVPSPPRTWASLSAWDAALPPRRQTGLRAAARAAASTEPSHQRPPLPLHETGPRI
ncbi:unnamed protein product [Rangifer tarandus platyrhynchus]|uniref:Uncharacterized protein n=2 Tax=Rangifer tarandus platyrhynchus TaxID=3082113 RepID=A0ABN8ZF61_RANTA|nr:unnamed protein product [Rangifer tarandus platyrhynchus]CAI9707624.1 unnamed protein product [Rangifer tarandus platyrhynchus]